MACGLLRGEESEALAQDDGKDPAAKTLGNEPRERLRPSTGLLLWAVEGGQLEPLPRLCMAADMAEGNIVKASTSHTRFR
jgi:hypothetical protein